MTFDKIEYIVNSKSKEGIIKLYFTDIDHSAPQMDNQITRSIILTIQEWTELQHEINSTVGIG